MKNVEGVKVKREGGGMEGGRHEIGLSEHLKFGNQFPRFTITYNGEVLGTLGLGTNSSN